MTDRSNKEESKPAAEDVALICGSSEDGSEVAILRKRADRVEAGIARKLEQGKAISGEVVRLTPRADSPLCDVETLVAAPRARDTVQKTETGRGHPAQVASDTYREGWEAIWSRSRSAPKLLN